jgi:hypothetical protein
MFYKHVIMLFGIFKNFKTRYFQFFPNYQMISAFFLFGETDIK